MPVAGFQSGYSGRVDLVQQQQLRKIRDDAHEEHLVCFKIKVNALS